MKVRKFLFYIILSILLLPNITWATRDNPKVYLIVTNKLTLEDITFMDNLNKIVENGSIGLMNTRGTSGYTGAESFLTINSSRKAYANYTSIDFQSREIDNTLVNNAISKLINLNKNNSYSPTIGAIGENIHNIGLKTAIYGNSDLIDIPYRTSALIPMDSEGLIDYGNIDDITIVEEKYSFGLKTDYNRLLKEIINSPGDFIVGDTGDLERIFRYSDNLIDKDFTDTRNKILLDIDIFIRDLTSLLDYENSLLIIMSPNNGDPRVDGSKLSPIILWGKGIEEGILTSSTTNIEGIVTNLDIGPTIMGFLNGTTDNMSGNPIKIIKKNINLNDIIIQNQNINITSKIRYNSLYYYGIISVLLMSLPIIIGVARIKITKYMEDIIRTLMISLFAIPNIFILISLFRLREIYIYVIILLVLILLTIILVWKMRKYSNIPMILSSFSVFLILLDIILKGVISTYSPLSYDPVIGARYYGIGNEMVGLLLGSITVLSINILGKNNKSLLPLFLFIISTILVGHPNYGANVGGTMAFIIATVFYSMELLNKKLSISKIFFAVALIIIIIITIGYVDIKYSTNTTHLGTTILLIKNSGLSYLVNIVIRKMLMNIKLVGRSFWTYVLLFLMVFNGIIIDLFKEIDKKVLMAAIAGITGVIGGFLLNDSGVILAAIAMNLITTGLLLEYI